MSRTYSPDEAVAVPERAMQSLRSRYQERVLDIIASRFRVAALLFIPFYLLFFCVDKVLYHDQSLEFLKIRVLTCLLVLLGYAASHLSFFKKNILWLTGAVALSVAAGICWMVYLSDAVTSSYHEGINLLFFGILIVNSFYFLPNLFLGGISFCLYVLSVLGSIEEYSAKFVSVCFFMLSTLFFVCVMTRLYGKQHFKEFVRTEDFKESDRKLSESLKRLEKIYNNVERLASIDDLTKICNRRYFFEMLTKKIKIADIRQQSFYLAVFDIDHFKKINDFGGHVFGDKVIFSVAQTVRSSIPWNAFLGRYGGDEFMALLDAGNKEELKQKLEGIAEQVKQIKFHCDGEDIRVSLSFGASKYQPGKGRDAEKLLKTADDALFSVKRAARGGIQIIE